MVTGEAAMKPAVLHPEITELFPKPTGFWGKLKFDRKSG
jgi:hypothetical protein